ncbi:hypothetical protein KGR20_23225 [Cytobacillus oceanisediminis]|uniref:Uncharacterized protein n=1 Tax=Niallia alba TaxID=2729105 RepID=A0A7Y0PKI3_9BACI|nr:MULTISPECIES: hypothetical protein [Bacillaceae]MBZ9537075.1 hypothetical protein [Cytobacillus oceanisediminis]NMO75710.1 hypothetical protein [Niallia alba]UTI43506.1 hypothetical protein NKG37_07470 [Niallia sp. RD1]
MTEIEETREPEKFILIDCDPLAPRPNRVLKKVLKGTGITSEKEPIFKIFGAWKWDYSEVDDETWNKVIETIEERLDLAYENGWARRVSWYPTSRKYQQSIK